MTEQEFWEIVDATRADVGDGTPDEWVDALREQLEKKSGPQLVAFDRIFRGLQTRAYDWGLWGAFHVMQGGCGDDAFIDSRTWLIFQGKNVYESALADPDTLAELRCEDPPSAFEELAYVAPELYEKLTGEEEMPHVPEEVPETPSGEEWDEEDEDAIKARWPRLFERYGATPL